MTHPLIQNQVQISFHDLTMASVALSAPRMGSAQSVSRESHSVLTDTTNEAQNAKMELAIDMHLKEKASVAPGKWQVQCINHNKFYYELSLQHSKWSCSNVFGRLLDVAHNEEHKVKQWMQNDSAQKLKKFTRVWGRWCCPCASRMVAYSILSHHIIMQRSKKRNKRISKKLQSIRKPLMKLKNCWKWRNSSEYTVSELKVLIQYKKQPGDSPLKSKKDDLIAQWDHCWNCQGSCLETVDDEAILEVVGLDDQGSQLLLQYQSAVSDHIHPILIDIHNQIKWPFAVIGSWPAKQFACTCRDNGENVGPDLECMVANDIDCFYGKTGIGPFAMEQRDAGQGNDQWQWSELHESKTLQPSGIVGQQWYQHHCLCHWSIRSEFQVSLHFWWQDLHDDDKTCMQSSYWELILENGQWLGCWITDRLCALRVAGWTGIHGFGYLSLLILIAPFSVHHKLIRQDTAVLHQAIIV